LAGEEQGKKNSLISEGYV